MKRDVKRKIFSRAIAPVLALALSVPAMAAVTPFTDVPADAWYAQDVVAVQELGIIQGKGNGRFDPDGTLTIAEAVTLAAKTRAHDNDEAIPSVEGGSWYSGALKYATEQGIVSGTEFSNYNQSATRGEMAYLFARALPDTEYKVINSITELPDVDGNTTYSTEIFKLYHAGIVTGSDKYGTYQPDSQITRAQATAILNRVVHPETRKVLTLEKAPVFDGNDGERTPRPTPLTLRWDDPTRPYAREGDIFIAQDGKEYKLTRDAKTGIVGYGQPIATELGRTDKGQTVTDGGIVFDLSRPVNTGNQYLINDHTGEGHWVDEWNRISSEYYPDYDATQEGELSKDKNFEWSTIMSAWNLVVEAKR